MRRPKPSSIATFVAVGGLVAFIFWQFDPSLLLSNTTTSGGDTGAHVALPAFMRDHLLPHGRLTGWDRGWYDGFPAFTFYFPLPSFLIVVLNVVLPYNVAFKLVTALGSLALPVAAWAFGKLWRMPGAGPAFLAGGSLLYLFDRSYTIYGGNIPSTLAGEYSFSLSLAVGLVFLGVVASGIRTRRRAALAAFLLAVTGLCHMLPALFVIVGAVVILFMSFDWHRLRSFDWRRLRSLRGHRVMWMAGVLVTGGLLAGFWWVPFLLRLRYTTDMGWVKITTYRATLVPPHSSLQWVALAALVGALVSVLRRQRLGIFLTIMAVLAAVGFVVAPQGKIWNARLLPFWVLCLYLLAAVAAAEVGRLIAIGAARLARLPDSEGHVALPVLGAAAAVAIVGVPLQIMPSWFPVKTATASFIPDWVRWNYSGYQSKAAYPEYRSIINTFARVGATQGCGNAMWEYSADENRFGTPEALMLLPYWTSGCIGSMEGLLFESASTTPYHFINQSELSAAPSDAMMGLPYGGFDLNMGIQHLQLLGVRYYMAFSPQIQREAAANPNLQLLASSGPWEVNNGSGPTRVTWDIYEVRNSATVAPLSYLPAVAKGLPTTAKGWLSMSMAWYDNPDRWPVPIAATGPKSWPRVGPTGLDPPAVPVTPARVSRISVGDDRITFNVDRIGSPVVVRASYFPNWQASGAQGPYRITPNLMVVVPTSRHVSLHYGWTPVDWLGWASTGLGVVGLVLLSFRPPLPLRRRRESTEPGVDAREEEDGTAVDRELVGVAAGDGPEEEPTAPSGTEP